MKNASALRAAIAALALAMGTATVCAQDHSHHGQPDKQAPSTVRIKLANATLTDQHGKTVRLDADAMAGRLVLVNFIYTTCTTVCPVQSALFADLQQRLGERMGRDIAMYSITVDPLRDTPLRLKEFSAQYRAGPAWRFLTGSQQAVDEVLKSFDVYTANFADHPAVVLVGDPATGEWTRFYGFPGSDQIMGRINQLQAGRHGSHKMHSH